MFEDFRTKSSLTIVFTGEGKGKTSASLGLTVRALGTGWRVAYIQFIKHWEVGEHRFLQDIAGVYGDNLLVVQSGKGFYEAGGLSAKGISATEHKAAAAVACQTALECVQSGEYDLVVCDEINNAVADKLLDEAQLEALLNTKHATTNLCLTGRNFPKRLLASVDIATEMKKLKHHFDEGFLANKGIDY